MRVKMTIGTDTFEFSGLSVDSCCAALKQWLVAIGKGQPAADALADKLEQQTTKLSNAVAANTPNT